MAHQQTVISEHLITTFFPKQFLTSLQLVPEAAGTVSSLAPSVTSHPKLVRKLQVARAKLHPTDGPQLLKYLAYLRISCNLMQQMQGTSVPTRADQDLTPPYSRLVEALTFHDRDWWTHCTVSSIGCLRSSDAVVDQLLSAIEQFHQLYG
jgi:hypothetical protein